MKHSVMGYYLPAPKRTSAYFIGMFLYFVLPFLSLLLGLDILLYFIFEEMLDSCYAVLCLFD